MNKSIVALCTAFLLFTSIVSAQTNPTAHYVGTWKGEMIIGRTLPLELSFEMTGTVLKGSFVDPQSRKAPMADLMAVKNAGIVFRLDRGEGSNLTFAGNLSADKTSLSGTVTIYENRIEKGKGTWKVAKADNAAAKSASVPASSPTRLPEAQAAYTRGISLIAKNDHAGAAASFTECLRVAPTDVTCLGLRSAAYRRLSKKAEALKDLDAVFKLSPKPPPAVIIARADLRIELENYEGAISDADKLFTDYGSAEAYRIRGKAYELKGVTTHFNGILFGGEVEAKKLGLAIWSKALPEFNKYIQADPKNWRGYADRGMYYFSLWNGFSDGARLSDSLTDLNLAIQLAPNVADNYFNREQTNRALGNAAAADADRAKWNELNKKSPPSQ